MTGANLYNAYLIDPKVSDETLKDTVLCRTVLSNGQQEDIV